MEVEAPAIDWSVENGVLTISGENVAISGYASGSATPWYAYRSAITSIVIEDGVTAIGRYAFSNLGEVVSVEISASVVRLEYYAFNYCSSLSRFSGMVPKNLL